jgi:multicomponent K+:H+ antiporter subunit E/multicomponent Na+:H+ antiporter subunit E
MGRGVAPVGLLLALYLLLVARAGPADVLVGLAVSGAVLLGLRRFLRATSSIAGAPVAPVPRRIIAVPRLALAAAVEVARGTLQVARVVLGQHRPRRGVIEVPIQERSPGGVVVTAFVLTLAPGTALLDIDWDRQVMIIDALDATSPDALRAHLQQFYERYQRPVAP